MSRYGKNGKWANTHQHGAALLAVLVVAVIMVVLMGVASTMLESRMSLAQDSKQQFRDHAYVYAKQNELIYLLATQRSTAVGISQGSNARGLLKNNESHWLFAIIGDEIRADGHVNIEKSGLTFSLQNEDGLIPVNSSGQYWMKSWLKANGYNSAARAKYSDTLADYADSDDLRRPAGAEKSTYKRIHKKRHGVLSLPANFLLQSCNELWQVAGWHTLLTQFPLFIDRCSLRRSASLNMNAVPISLWQTLWPNSAAKITTMREQNKWFLSYSDILAAEPSVINILDDYYSHLGGTTFSIKVQLNSVDEGIRVVRGTANALPFIIKH